MNLLEEVKFCEKVEDAIASVKDNCNLVVLRGKHPDQQCVTFIYRLFVNKDFNKKHREEMQKLRKKINMKRITDRDKKILLGKGTCAKVHCYEIDPIIESMLNPDTFKQYVVENTLDECNPSNTLVAQV